MQKMNPFCMKKSSLLYRFPFVQNKRPKIGPADYWSLTLTRRSSPRVGGASGHETTVARGAASSRSNTG